MLLSLARIRRFYCMEEKLNFLPLRDFARIQIEGAIITVNVHELTCPQMERLLRNISALLKDMEYSLIIIHGYNNGTVLKEAIRKDDIVYRPHTVVTNKFNLGVTTYVFAA